MKLMIKLIDNYAIMGNERDYSLVKFTGKKDKNGKDTYRICGYYGTVAACIKGCFKEKCLELVAEEDMELKEAAEEFEKIEKRLESIMPEVFKR